MAKESKPIIASNAVTLMVPVWSRVKSDPCAARMAKAEMAMGCRIAPINRVGLTPNRIEAKPPSATPSMFIGMPIRPLTPAMVSLSMPSSL